MEISGKYDIYSDTDITNTTNKLKFSPPAAPVSYGSALLPGALWWPESWVTLTGRTSSFNGDSRSNWVNGSDGNNFLFGAAGDDILNGGRGSDRVVGGEGNDLIQQDANDVSGDRIYGGSGIDTLDYSVTSLPVTSSAAIGTRGIQADLSAGRVAKLSGVYDMVSEVENVLGTPLDDQIVGNAENNILSGGAGNDRLYGGQGNDTLYGGAGGDWLIGGAGNDYLIGEAGDDLYKLTRGSGQDRIRDHDTTANNHDTLVIGTASRIGNTTALSNDISAQQVWLRHVGNDLEISVIGSNDKVTVQDWYSGGSQNRVESIQLGNGRILGANIPTNPSLISSVETLVQAMASFVPPAAGQVNLPPSYAAKLAPLIEANWSQPDRAGSMTY